MDLICAVLRLYVFVILARVIFSWIRVTPGTPVASIYSVIFNLTEPVLGPLRQDVAFREHAALTRGAGAGDELVRVGAHDRRAGRPTAALGHWR